MRLLLSGFLLALVALGCTTTDSDDDGKAYRGNVHITMTLDKGSQRVVSDAYVKFGPHRTVGGGIADKGERIELFFNHPVPDEAEVVVEFTDDAGFSARVPLARYRELLEDHDVTFVFVINSDAKAVRLEVAKMPLQK